MRQERRERDKRRSTNAVRSRQFLYLGAVVLVVAALLLAITLRPVGGPGVSRGEHAEDFTVTDVDGNDFRLSAQRGDVVVIDWMGVRCPPCRTQMPELVELDAAYRSRGLVMISIDIGDFGSSLAAENEDQARAFLAEFGATWPIALERSGLATRYGIVGIPTVMIVDPSGLIVSKEAGIHTFEDLRTIVEPRLPG